MDSNSWEIVEEENYGSEIKFNDNKNLEKSTRYGQNVKNYETEWRDLCMIISSDDDLKKLREKAVGGDLKVSKFRSVIWNVLLGSLEKVPENWIQEKQEQRARYSEIRAKHILDADQLQEAEKLDDPLSQSKDSKWNQHFRDVELRQLIKQDVVRTNPNVDYYHTPQVQEIMINILFCYAREYPSICYRQGMHEILAPLIFVLHCDLQALGHIQEETSISLDPLLMAVLNPNYIEEDSYILFCQIMNSLELFYRINDMTITESGQLTNIPKSETPSSSSSSPVKTVIATTGASPKRTSEIEVVHQLNLIRDKIFAKQDLHLHNHLLKLEIPLALFGIRWLRLLFGREFNLLDLLILWDAIFGIGDNLKFTYYIVVAMLIHVRDRLLSNDYTTCLTLLMRYPANVDISLIIRHALYMCDPDKYQCPPNAFVYVISSLKQRQIQPTRVYPPLATAGIKVSFSSPRKLRDEIRKESAKVTHRKTQNEDGVVEGMALDDPEVLKMELQDSYNVMSVTRLKLLQYLSILRKYIPGNQIDELHQTLDGIEELCSLLKPKHQFIFNASDAVPIDAAFEADDFEEVSPSHISRSFPMSVEKLKVSSSASYEMPTNRVTKNTGLMLQKNRAEVEMSLIRTADVGCIDLSQYPSENPVGDRRNSVSD